MRTKTSFTLDERALTVARTRAAHEGVPLSVWVEQAIINEVARNDVQLIEEWERGLPPEDQAVLAAFAEVDINLGT